jgi:hypothetical protein
VELLGDGLQAIRQALEDPAFLVVIGVAEAHSPGMPLDFGRQKLGVGHFFPC